MNIEQATQIVKNTAKNCGFDFCGIAKVQKLDEDARRLESWLNKGLNGSMGYMEKYFDMRVNPALLVPGAQSVITLLINYFPSESQSEQAPKISKYAFGKDYHEIIKGKLNTFLADIREQLGDINGRGFVDSAPVLERTWAQKTGLGWVGKNGMLINKGAGSYFFISTLIIDYTLLYDQPMVKDFCGSCTKCIEACPTEAILPGKVINGSKCISYFTIELKEMLIPEQMSGKLDNWLFGCDVCQDVCPWNRFSKPNQHVEFKPIAEILNFTTQDWIDLTEDKFREIFRYSPLKRSKFKGIMRNLKFLSS